MPRSLDADAPIVIINREVTEGKSLTTAQRMKIFTYISYALIHINSLIPEETENLKQHKIKIERELKENPKNRPEDGPMIDGVLRRVDRLVKIAKRT